MKLARGAQITIGAKSPKHVAAFTFQVPERDPITDDEVRDAHELIARIEKAREPYEEVVDTAKAAIDQIEEGIRATFRERLEEESTDGPEHQHRLVEVALMHPPTGSGDPVKVGEVIDKVVERAAGMKLPSGTTVDSVTIKGNGKSVTLKRKGGPRSAMKGLGLRK